MCFYLSRHFATQSGRRTVTHFLFAKMEMKLVRIILVTIQVMFQFGFRCFFDSTKFQGFARKTAFIVTQGPMTETLQDFWTMIWGNGAEDVVMLTKLEEKGL